MRTNLKRMLRKFVSASANLIILVSLLASQLPSPIMSGEMKVAQAAPTLTTYVVPAVSDTKILPKSSISSSYLGNSISIQAAFGEYRAASFVVNSNEAISALVAEASGLTGSAGTISSENVDLRTVKVWYQAGNGPTSSSKIPSGRYLTPELLLKDDSLVRVDGDLWTSSSTSNPDGKNYLKLTNGTYIDISGSSYSGTTPTIASRPVKDAATLQPFSLPADYNKQFWITMHVPDSAAAGDYAGTIALKSGTQTLKTLSLNVKVLPIELAPTDVEHSVRYYPKITTNGSMDDGTKTEAQFTAEQINMYEHGITNPSVFPADTDAILLKELAIRRDVGLDNTNLYYGKEIPVANIAHIKEITAPYGVENIYSYGPDEREMSRELIESEHAAGAFHYNAEWEKEVAAQYADVLDILTAARLWPDVIEAYHSNGNRVFSYGNPQAVSEYPNTIRRNYGLYLWQKDYDGTMTCGYQWGVNDIWNDFDSSSMRDHYYTLPTMDGVIDTTVWEGFREGINDVRYQVTLENAIAQAKTGANSAKAIEAENYLSTLKTSDLSSQDIDTVRSRMVSYILALDSSAPATTKYALTVTNGSGDGSYASGTSVTITANSPATGKVFDKWTGATSHLASTTSATTTVTMPAAAITLTATYKDAPVTTYALTVNYGTGDGSYAQGTSVTITANTPATGKVFDRWTGSTSHIASTTSATTTVTMPGSAITLTATYKDAGTSNPASGFSECIAHNAGFQMSSANENNSTKLQFNYAEYLGDGRGITFGAIGFCTGTYDGNELIKYYTTLSPNNNLAKYIPALNAIDAAPHDDDVDNDGNDSTTGLDGFIAAVHGNTDAVFGQAQVSKMDEIYWEPAMALFNSIGAKYNLTAAFIYDMTERHGEDIAQILLNQTTSALGGTPKTGVDEKTYLTKLFAIRDAKLAKEASVVGDQDRDAGYKAILASGNVDLVTPYAYSVYGDQYTIVANANGINCGTSTTKYALTVNSGSGSGSYASGDKVTVTANLPTASSKVFDKWTGDTAYLSSTTAVVVTLTMPAKAIAVTATYKDVGTPDPATGFSLTVNQGSGDGKYAAGAKVIIKADAAPTGQVFDRWTGDTAYLVSVTSAATIVTMPGKAISLTATYREDDEDDEDDEDRIDLPDGTLIKLPDSPKVYVIINGEKKWISTPEQFEQMGYKWMEIASATLDILEKIADVEKNLIRLINDYRVYMVTDGVRRHVPNPSVFEDYGFSWDDVEDVDESTMKQYKDTYLVRQSGDDKVYYLNDKGVRKHIPTEKIFDSYGDRWEDVQIISKTEMESYPLSSLIQLEGSNQVYLVSANAKKLIPDATTFNRKGYDWNHVISVNKTEFDYYQDGGTVK